MALHWSRYWHAGAFGVGILSSPLWRHLLQSCLISSAHVLSKCALKRGCIKLPLCWHELRLCLAPGDEMDGSSSCQSEHKAPEHLLQSVVPVLYIDRSKLCYGADSGQLLLQVKALSFSFSAPFALKASSVIFSSSLFVILVHPVLSLCNNTPLWLCHVSVTQSHLSLPANIMNQSFPLESPAIGMESPIGLFHIKCLLIAKT